jgi:tetratricopeptide (TPR) repeat protein
MKCPVCRATYRLTDSQTELKPCHRCGADLAMLIQLHDRAITHHRQAIDRFIAGDYTAAMVENDRAIALHSQYPAFHAFAGQLFALEGKFDRAKRSWQLAQKLDPQNTLASVGLELLSQ